MVWYEKVLLGAAIVLTAAALVYLVRPIGPDAPYGILAAVLGILGAVSILERRRRASRSDS